MCNSELGPGVGISATKLAVAFRDRQKSIRHVLDNVGDWKNRERFAVYIDGCRGIANAPLREVLREEARENDT
jgi:hypothetical protein